jgi:iron complex outermembrane receptor protein
MPDSSYVRGYDTSSARWAGSEATLSRQFGRDRITVGGQYEYSYQIKQATYCVGQPATVNVDDPQWLAAWYAQAELRFKSKLAINAGMRLDWVNPYGVAFSPRIAVVYRLNSRNSLKYIYGKAFRSPNAYENWYQDGSVIGPHSWTLRPENIESHTAMFESRLAPWNELIVEGFYNRLTNLIDLNPNPATGLLAFSNSGQYRSRGMGAEFDAHTQSGVSAKVSYMLAEAHDTYGHQVASDPANMIKLNLSAPLRTWIVGGAEVQFTSSQYTLLANKIPSTAIANLTLSTLTLWNDWQFSASVYNLLDRSWYAPAGPGVGIDTVQQDGRSFRIKLTYRLPFGGSRKP